MRRSIATTISGLLLLATTISHAGQHTGVGGNPVVPPPTPANAWEPPPSVVIQTLIQPLLVIIIPDLSQLTPEGEAEGKTPAPDENSAD